MRGTAHCTVTGCRQGPTKWQANARWPDGQLTPCYIRVRLKKPLKIGSIRVAKLSMALQTRIGVVRIFGIDTSVTAIVAASDLDRPLEPAIGGALSPGPQCARLGSHTLSKHLLQTPVSRPKSP